MARGCDESDDIDDENEEGSDRGNDDFPAKAGLALGLATSDMGSGALGIVGMDAGTTSASVDTT